MEIIAEIGQNHNGDISLAKELIHAAKENGADVAKFQLYNAKSLFPQEGNEWFEYNCQTEISRDQLNILVKECNKCGIEFMASPFDIERVQWLEEEQVKRYKIASRSIQDEALIRRICRTQKPIIASLGLWQENELPKIESPKEVSFLYCVCEYPTPLSHLNFSAVDFTNKYNGFSDHSEGTVASKIAISRGAKIIENHFTLDKKMHGPDHAGSMTTKELKDITDFRNDFQTALSFKSDDSKTYFSLNNKP